MLEGSLRAACVVASGVGGGVIGRLGDYFAQSGFRAAFEAKGRFAPYMQRIPTYVIRAQQPALMGCAMGLGITPNA